ncbi:MAG: c-type cytochrome [Burkholderiales bacterium]|nr:c-type cytochrome [Burkholderiales bacterium]
MRSFATLLLLTSLAGVGDHAHADDRELLTELLTKNNCTACHFIDKRKYGPKLKDVAAKYANDESAVEKLAARIKAGSTGVWGQDVMPPQPQVSDADALALARYVLSLH